MRKKKKIDRPLQPDHIYGDPMVAKFINHVMRRGKRATAQQGVYGALKEVEVMTKKPPLETFKTALENASPFVEVISRRIGGATYQIPKEVRGDRRMALAMRWIIEAARTTKGTALKKKLAVELVAAAKGEGKAVKKKLDLQKVAEANRAFAHLAW